MLITFGYTNSLKILMYAFLCLFGRLLQIRNGGIESISELNSTTFKIRRMEVRIFNIIYIDYLKTERKINKQK